MLLPSVVLLGRYNNIPYESRLCACGEGTIETLSHVILECKIYEQIREWLIKPCIPSLDGRDRKECLQKLLEDRNKEVTNRVAKFGRLAIKLRDSLMNDNDRVGSTGDLV